MRIDDIKALAEILQKYNLSAIEAVDGEYKIKVEKQVQTVSDAPAAVTAPINIAAKGPSEWNKNEVFDADVLQVKSPMVGVFYAAPSPESEPFVSLGKKVKKGDVLCIVEAMKLMNEIMAEADGEVIDICVANGQVVEFGQELFKLSKGSED
ncbi:MAG: acetyl-CoA carboxylase biotin carboxyl carrier protein [Bacillota bacterium]|jgi:acetyl-CoA carboxylase biotin carboxyl carrier protein